MKMGDDCTSFTWSNITHETWFCTDDTQLEEIIYEENLLSGVPNEGKNSFILFDNFTQKL